ncbi:hypothetical protein HQ447_17530 [bacterium]|nr:hypothetical protein [bacterium]
MKTNIRKLILCALAAASGSANAVTVGVNSSETWIGYMNWFELPSNGGAYVSGGSWGVADLKAAFAGGSLTLKACPINNPASPYWYVTPGGPGIAGNKSMEALMYVEKTGPLSGQSVTFSGTVQASSWASGYATYAFIKDFAPNYSSSVESVSPIPLTAGSFSVTLNTIADPTRHVQYGFKTVGANVWPTDVDSKGFIQIQDVPPPFVPDVIPNGDFEIPGGSGWATETTNPTISFPTAAGNPLGNAVIDATAAEGFAAIKAFNGAEKTFASLGLTPGETYTFRMDMKILAGSNIGGLRMVGPAGYEFLNRPTIIGDGSTWETYSIPFTVPAAPTQALFSLVWGFNSKVAFDNVMIVLPGPSAPLQAAITQGTSVSWTAASATNQYQPQEGTSISGPWTNLGSPLVGNTVSSVFDSSKSPFYQVLESVPFAQETAYNGTFALEGIDAEEADGWDPIQSQAPFRLTTGGRTDNGACMQLKVLNAADESNGSEIKQDTNSILDNENGAIIPGNNYTLSFWAKQISSGPSYVQEYRVTFLAPGGGELPPGGGTWQSFSAPVGGDWQQKTLSGLVAPAGAESALIQIVGKTGAVLGGLGEVLIDDVSLLSSSFGSPTVLAAATVPAVEISWPSLTGQDYQVQSSADLGTWANFGSVISGNGSLKAVYDTMAAPLKFYRVGELP